MSASCGAYQHHVSQVGDAEYRCWRCGADEGVMEREEEDAPACPTMTPEPHLLGEFPMTCHRCHLEVDA